MNTTVSTLPRQVIKRSGERVAFDAGKIRSALERAGAASGEFDAKRRHQALAWMWQQIDSGLRQRFREHPAVNSALAELSVSVEAGTTTPVAAAQRLLALVGRNF